MTVYILLEPVLYTANYCIMTRPVTLRLAGGGQTSNNSVLSVHAVTVTLPGCLDSLGLDAVWPLVSLAQGSPSTARVTGR